MCYFLKDSNLVFFIIFTYSKLFTQRYFYPVTKFQQNSHLFHKKLLQNLKPKGPRFLQIISHLVSTL